MIFDGTISLGNILTIVSIAATGFAFIMTMKGDVKLLSARLDKVDAIMSKVTDALIQIARQEERLDHHAKRIEHLERRQPH